VASIYDRDLDKNAANYASLTPLSFVERAAAVYPERTAVIHGERRYRYREFYARCRRLAAALRRRGIGPGDTVSVMAPNVPELLEAHYGVAMAGAVLNAINTRLDAATVAFILGHGGAKAVITDTEYAEVMGAALARTEQRPLVIDIDDPQREPGRGGEPLGEATYEAFLESAPGDAGWDWPTDEWQAYALNYTSGTTGNPKGVVYSHRGAFLNAIGNAISFGLDRRTVYLWTLPMFHCNGWTHTWAVTAVAGTHVCLRQVDPVPIFALIRQHGVTHMCGAPIVLNLLIHAPEEAKQRCEHVVEVATGGAAPPSAVIAAMQEMGFRVTHLYGLTESYGPATLCAWQEAWDALPQEAQAARVARQGVNYLTLEAIRVAEPEPMADVPADGRTIGEVMLRGNTLMKGYLKNPAATEEAFRGGWFHTGDLAVRHPDGYIEVKDRAKDIIISGGENVSSLEIEEVLYRHPKVMEAAVVARPDEKWGETPCAFVALKPGQTASEGEIIDHCRDNMAGFKVPRTVLFGPLPKTSTGKIQKFRLRERAKSL
jgi:fatty-acyl-CoA synthase